ncbi:polyphenol oxidase family protein [Haloferula rosea]|uniref:Polyphenol oxidase family protein n=1 Tax=Haloferula rosea TaxID=490093 RepID=A0A934R6E4_9BACT|nr:polyphenol oxidase family protein [Haloferula rosea]
MTEALSFLDPLKEISGVRVDFVERIDGINVNGERDEVLERLDPAHRLRARSLSGSEHWWKAEQVHGGDVAVVEDTGASRMIPGVDGLVTRLRGETLGIYVADCGAIWMADRRTGAVGLLHSGKKGTEANILKRGVEALTGISGSAPGDLVVVLGPCIRPPHYEVDFAATIRNQASDLGVGGYHDCGIDTAGDPDRYYSYRMERGRTGRMLALIVGGAEA